MILRNHERRPRFRARQPPPFACHCEPVRGWGPRKGTPFAGGGAPRERCSPLAFRRRGAWRTLRREVWQSVLPAGKPGKVAAVWANSLRLTNSPKVLLFFAPCRGVTDCHVASLLAMTCRNMPGGCIIPGAAGILPENAPATAVPGQVFAHPSRQTPPRPLY